MTPQIAELQARRRYASILMTYSCTVACEHCCFNCRPRKETPAVSAERAVAYLAEFHKLDRAIHIAGGESFQHYDQLRAILRAAHEAGVPPHFVETNGTWCENDGLVRERMIELRGYGVLWMLISTDPYHFRQLPLDRVARGIRIAEEVFGEGTTMGLAATEELERRVAVGRDDAAWRAWVHEHPPMLVGRSARVFASCLEPRPLADLRLDTTWGIDRPNTCSPEWDPFWEIHVDPYGQLQTNCGIMLGNADEIPLTELLQTWHARNAILGRIAWHGVAALVEIAQAHGFQIEDAYPQKCLLCWQIRSFLRKCDDRFRSVFGPDELYEEAG